MISCVQFVEEINVENRSRQTVFAHFNASGQEPAKDVILEPGKAITLTNFPFCQSYEGKPKNWVTTEKSYKNLIFKDALPVRLIIFNSFSTDMKISAKGKLETEPLKCFSHEEIETTIYTEKPEFEIIDFQFPATVEFNIVDGVIYAIIK
jgi:hypothetical protein